MGILSNIEPKEVFQYFEELSMVPRSTFHTKKISDFCVEFAKAHNLEYIQDEVNNVIIKKPGTPGYENSDPVIIQGHLDMVATKTNDSHHDFENDPLELFVDGDLIGARDTTLGGDDGIAVAYAMAILASTDIPHPPIEAVFTVDEEIGMGGANHLDTSVLKGKICLNIDSEIEGVMTVGCAGGYVYDTFIPIEWSEENGTKMTLSLTGLLGGHSGGEIQKQLGNANKIMARILYALAKDYDFNLVSIHGGSAANVIAQFNTAEIIAESSQVQAITEAAAELEKVIIDEFSGQEPSLSLKVSAEGDTTIKAFDADTTSRVIGFLYGAIDGVQCYDRAFPTAVESSLNTGIVETTEDTVKVKFQVRSSVATKLTDMQNKLDLATDYAGASREISGAYPAWAYRSDSAIRPKALALYKEMFGKEPTVETTHGGLECGILFGKKPDLDIISFGPDLTGVHTYHERVHIASTQRMWEYLKELLKNCK